jgi:hypothetical protein
MVRVMLFRPSFCANCGEKIDRVDWGILTSRRFCPVCESEFKGQDLIPRVIVAASLLVGAIGVGGYLKSGSAVSESQLLRQPQKLMSQQLPVAQAAPKELPVNSAASVSGMPEIQSKMPAPKSEIQTQEPPKQPAKFQAPEVAEEVYFCGAKTAKGTPCMHRVKGNVRCFQHVGMPAMLPSDKLRIK